MRIDQLILEQALIYFIGQRPVRVPLVAVGQFRRRGALEMHDPTVVPSGRNGRSAGSRHGSQSTTPRAESNDLYRRSTARAVWQQSQLHGSQALCSASISRASRAGNKVTASIGSCRCWALRRHSRLPGPSGMARGRRG